MDLSFLKLQITEQKGQYLSTHTISDTCEAKKTYSKFSKRYPGPSIRFDWRLTPTPSF